MKILGVVPARYASQRFPGKPLALIAGKPMVEWVYAAARRALPRVIVATDDRRILDFVRGKGGEAMMTSSRCQSGTDRVAEVARRVRADVYFNIQGDEPLMSSRTVRRVLALHRDRRVQMGTAATALPGAAWGNPDVVKVLVDRNGDALYFSRAALPCFRDPKEFGMRSAEFGAKKKKVLPHSALRSQHSLYKHLGIYSYRADLLRRFVGWPQTFLERAEKLEQLRALENGVRIRVALTPDDSVGVDRPEDARAAARALRSRKIS